MKRVIGVTDPMKEDATTINQYITWLTQNDPGIEARVLSYMLGNGEALKECSGLLITGGGDVDPSLYGRPDAAALMKGIDRRRDDFEIGLINEARRMQLPVMGICRGAQIYNVAQGGTLVPDLQAAGFGDHRRPEKGERLHAVSIGARSLLHAAVQCSRAVANSYHHQAIDRPGDDLKVTARSDDGVAEAAEWGDPGGEPFLLLVQWHPERMQDPENILSGKIREKFLEATRKEKHAHLKHIT